MVVSIALLGGAAAADVAWPFVELGPDAEVRLHVGVEPVPLDAVPGKAREDSCSERAAAEAAMALSDRWAAGQVQVAAL